MSKTNTGKPTHYVLPREMTYSQRENFYHAINSALPLEEAFAIVGTPVTPCEDVETVAFMPKQHGKGRLVRRADMEAHAAVQNAEIHLLEEVLAFYVKDEDRYLKEEGEAYGSIPTDVGIKARSAARRFHAREQAAKHEGSGA
ncbi:hypothetical protein [Komagataeibacter oboediens]|uniref:hypothetical protein n=1 Tax=Komagataeibacter oboediens TaxID=65958 RepID=UPI001C2CD8AE|nr:hypothetical protein [Komagataeibacter oboediens]MBV1823343.1 hypothetical protein [Komagataeibacter oboediens]